MWSDSVYMAYSTSTSDASCVFKTMGEMLRNRGMHIGTSHLVHVRIIPHVFDRCVNCHT